MTKEVSIGIRALQLRNPFLHLGCFMPDLLLHQQPAANSPTGPRATDC